MKYHEGEVRYGRMLAQIAGLVTLAVMAWASDAIVFSYDLAANYDSTRNTQYRAGDKPQVGASCTTWTCLAVGDAVGEVDEVSSTELDFATSSLSDNDDYVLAYKEFAAGNDVQVCATIPAQSSWTGHKENNTSFGVVIREGLTDGVHFAANRIRNLDNPPRLKIGTASANTIVTGSAATAMPETVCAVFDNSDNLWSGWQSNDGVTFTQVGVSVSFNPSGALQAGAFGTSMEVGQTTFATLTDVTATNTITIIGGAPLPQIVVGPTVGDATTTTIPVTFTANQTGTIFGVACLDGQTASTAQIKAGNCSGGAAVDAFSQAVVADVADADTFTGLTANTLYDLFYTVTSANGDAASPSSNADVQTDAGGGGSGTGSLMHEDFEFVFGPGLYNSPGRWQAIDSNSDCTMQTLTTGGAARGSRFMRFTLASSGPTDKSYRCELGERKAAGSKSAADLPLTLYYGMSFRIPTSVPFDPETQENFQQFHIDPVFAAGGGGVCHLTAQMNPSATGEMIWGTHGCNNGGAGGGEVNLLVPPTRGVWYRYCQKITWTEAASGVWKVWINPTSESSVPLKNYTGRTLETTWDADLDQGGEPIPDSPMPPKNQYGIYKPVWRMIHPPTNVVAMSPRMVDLDDIRIGVSYAEACQ